MKQLCFLIGNINHAGGTERVTTLIANQLAAEGYTVHILSLQQGDQPFFSLDSSIQYHALYPHTVSMKTHFIGCCLKIRHFVKKQQIDHLIVVDSISCVFTVPALWGLTVQHICWEHFNFKVDLGATFRRIGRQWAAKYCDDIVTLTQRDQDLWRQGLRHISATMTAIANPSPYPTTETRPQLAHKTMLAVGRFTAQKGFDLLLRAWAEFCQQQTDWTLKIIGGGEDQALLEQLLRELKIADRVQLLATTKDIGLYYQAASFYCMSSRFEGLPMVLLEAQAFGLPIISFDCDTGPAELIHHNQHGYLVEAENIQQFADYLLKASRITPEHYNEMVDQVKHNAEKYKLGSIISKWKDILEK
ncbi:glycosyltransferase family 4 protein [Acinetobacter larvae]|uniref:Glycosyl transferase family 1 domain-containing protein n=1 Tax=Acinetobacter larvae TaxID=1789224 RepID=A0A1B2LVP0_9GAMM|nr:glycosyltransferase family 4 protein [Acinetobacter larvae]AOA56996.1 hypothetical protein BFG52_00565 [Acinetobacter larvae]